VAHSMPASAWQILSRTALLNRTRMAHLRCQGQGPRRGPSSGGLVRGGFGLLKPRRAGGCSFLQGVPPCVKL
jgi:hypothetical protein